MARVTCSLRTAGHETVVHPATAARTLGAMCVADAAKHSGGPGWFDSSWDLHRGLEVREGLPGNATLNEWLIACLQG